MADPKASAKEFVVIIAIDVSQQAEYAIKCEYLGTRDYPFLYVRWPGLHAYDLARKLVKSELSRLALASLASRQFTICEPNAIYFQRACLPTHAIRTGLRVKGRLSSLPPADVLAQVQSSC